MCARGAPRGRGGAPALASTSKAARARLAPRPAAARPLLRAGRCPERRGAGVEDEPAAGGGGPAGGGGGGPGSGREPGGRREGEAEPGESGARGARGPRPEAGASRGTGRRRRRRRRAPCRSVR